MKRVLALLLSLSMILTLAPMTGFADVTADGSSVNIIEDGHDDTSEKVSGEIVEPQVLADGDGSETLLWSNAAALPTEGSWKLLRDVHLTSQVILTGDLSIDLDGHTIYDERTGGSWGTFRLVNAAEESGMTLTLANGICDGTDAAKNSFIYAKGNGDAVAVNLSKVEFRNFANIESDPAINEDGKRVSDTTSGRILNFQGKLNAEIKDCLFADSACESMGVIYIGATGTIRFINCEFENLSNKGYKTVNKDDAEKLDSFNGQCGALQLSKPADFYDCTFTDCTSLGNGGAAHITNGALFSGCSFKGCSASNGAAAYVSGTTATFENCSFDQNSAGNSGAIYFNGLTSNPTHYITGCSFTGNKSVSDGAAIRVSGDSGSKASATAIVDGCRFTGNETTGSNASVMIVATASHATIKDSIFTGNISAAKSGVQYGGALYNYNAANYIIEGATVVKDNFDIKGNPADFLLQGTNSIFSLKNPTEETYLNIKGAVDSVVEEGRTIGTLDEGTFLGTYKLSRVTTTTVKAGTVSLSGSNLITGALTNGHTHLNAKGEEIEYLPWSDASKLPSSGNYYLTVDVAVPSKTSTAQLTGDLNLCLNGHTISRADGSFWLLQVRGSTEGKKADAILNIDDCTGKGGFDGKGASVGSPFIGSSQPGCAGEINCKDIFFKNAKGTANGAPGITIQYNTKSTITNCVFENLTNTSEKDEKGNLKCQGYIIFGTANCTLEDCTVIGADSAFIGGGAANSTSIKVINNGEEYSAWNKDNSLPGSGKYALLGPVAVSSRKDVADNLTLNLNGQWVTRSASVGTLNVSTTDVLTIYDTTGLGGFDGNADLPSGSAVLMVQQAAEDGSQINFSNFTIKDVKGTENGGAITIQGACDANITNVTFDNCTNSKASGNGSILYDGGSGEIAINGCTFTNGGSIYSNGDAVIGGSSFINNTGTKAGAAITAVGSITVEKCLFDGNNTTGSGGAINATTKDSVIKYSTFTGNHATNGGAIFNGGGNTITIDGCTFDGNYSTTNGGAIYIVNGLYNISDSSFVNNGSDGDGETVTANGGAIYAQCGVTSGTKDAGGGHINAAQGRAVIADCEFTANKAKSSAGAFYAGSPTMEWNDGTKDCSGEPFIISGSCFTENEAGTYGGAIRIGHSGSYYSAADKSTNYTTKTELNITDTTFSGNKTGKTSASGGAFKIYSDSKVNAKNCSFTENIGQSGSAVSMNTRAEFIAEACTFTRNLDINQGKYAGAVYIANGTQLVTLIGGCTVKDNINTADEPQASDICLQDKDAFVTVQNPTEATELRFNCYAARTRSDKFGTIVVDPGCEEAAAAAVYGLGRPDENSVLIVDDNNDLVMAHQHDGITFLPWTDDSKLPTSGNYCLETDVTLSAGDYLRGDLNLCLNGHTVTYTKGSWFITVSTARTNGQRTDADPNAGVYVTNCSEEGGFDGEGAPAIGGPIIGSTEANKTGDPLMGSIKISNVAFRNFASNTQAGAVMAQGGTTLEISDCIFENCSGIKFGGAINSIGKGNAYISGCRFENCSVVRASGATDNGSGGAIYAGSNEHAVYIKDAVFEGCSAYAGSAINAGGTVDMYLEDVSFRNNTDLQTGAYSGAYYTTSTSTKLHLTGKIEFIDNFNSAATPARADLNIQNSTARIEITDLDADSVIGLMSGGKSAADFETLGTVSGEYANNIFWEEDESKFIGAVEGTLKFVEESNHIHDGVTYEAWTDASKLPASGNYFLTKDVNTKSQAAVTGELNLCLNGHTVTYDGSALTKEQYGVLRVNGSGVCHLTNCREGFGGFDGSKANSSTADCLGQTALLFTPATTTSDAVFTVENVRFFGLNNMAARAIVFQGSETATLTNCTFEDNTGTGSAAAIYATGYGKLTIEGCTFKNNTADNAAAIYRTQKADGEYHGETVITGNRIIDNTSTGTGSGAVTVSVGQAKAVISANTFEGNEGTIGGALRFAGTNDENAISDNTFSGNKAVARVVEQSTTKGRGGAISFNTNTFAEISGNRFESNTASNYGGAIYLNKAGDETAASSAIISGNTFADNTLTAEEDTIGADIFIPDNTKADPSAAVVLDGDTFEGAAPAVPAVSIGRRNDGVVITGTNVSTRTGDQVVFAGEECSSITVYNAEFTGFEGRQIIKTFGTLNVEDTVSDGIFYMDAEWNWEGIDTRCEAVVSGDTVATVQLSRSSDSWNAQHGDPEQSIIAIQGKNLGDNAEITVIIPAGDDINDYVFGPAIIEAAEAADTYKITAAFVEPGVNLPADDGDYHYNIVSASLDISDLLALNFTVDTDDPDAYMDFFLDGKKIADYDISKEESVYSLLALSPRAMTVPIKAVLYSGDGIEECVIDDYSVAMYIDGLYKNVAKYTDAKSEATKALLAGLVNYGSESQLSQGFNLKNLVSTGREWMNDYISSAEKPESVAGNAMDPIAGRESKIKGAGPKFAENISLYFNITARNDETVIRIEYTDDGSDYTTWKEGSITDLAANMNTQFSVNGKLCAIYTDGISYDKLDRIFKVTVLDDGIPQQSIYYSFNSYIANKWNDVNNGDMLRALEGFADAAVAYLAA